MPGYQVKTQNSDGSADPGVTIHIDWTDSFGVGAGTDDNTSDSTGQYTFPEPIVVLPLSATITCTKGLSYGKGSGQYWNGGSTTVTMKTDPLHSAAAYVSSFFDGFNWWWAVAALLALGLIALVLYFAEDLTKWIRPIANKVGKRLGRDSEKEKGYAGG